MDGLTIQALVSQLRSLFIGARIEKIHQPDERVLVLSVRTRLSTYRLLLSAHKQFPRIHFLTSRKPENPLRPPLFCISIRKHAEGGRITQIRQRGLDRIVEFEIEHINEIGDKEVFVLITELMGKNSNIILCRKESADLRIVDAISHVTPDMSRFRSVLPGLAYMGPPALDRPAYASLKPEDIALPDYVHLLAKANIQTVVKLVLGLGPVSAREILYRTIQKVTTDNVDIRVIQHALVDELRNLFTSVNSQDAQPSIGLDPLNRPVEYAPFPLTCCGKYKMVPTISDAIEQCYEDKTVRIRKSVMSTRLISSIETNIDKLRGKLSKIGQLEAESDGHEQLRIFGELLTAYPHLVRKGQTKAELPNFYDDDNLVEVKLNPALTSNQNAQQYFKQSSKRKRSIAILASEREKTEMDMHYLENVLTYVEQAQENPDCLEQIRHELELEGFMKPEQRKSRQGTTKNAEKRARSLDCCISSDGFVIRIGHNNAENDRLTFKQSQPRDIWLHVKDIPGSHVVIETAGKEPTEMTLEEASMLAAFYSKAQNSSNVQVDYTEIRHVWKQNGARPGQVLYKHQKTLFVSPDRDKIEALTSKAKNQP